MQKITIIPRTSGLENYAGGHRGQVLLTKEELENKIATLTGGRAAEEVVFGEITTGDRSKLDELAKYLYEKETITGSEFMKILQDK